MLAMSGSAAGVALMGGVYSFMIEPHWVDWVTHALPLENLPETWQEQTLIQISDLHIGAVRGTSYITEALRDIATFGPAAVVITGDLVHRGDAGSMRSVAAMLQPIAETCPVIVVLGNHDYGRAWRQYHLADRLAKMLRAAGVIMLRNASYVIAGLRFVGLDDWWAERFDPSRAFADWHEDDPTIALTHNPDTVDQPGWGRQAMRYRSVILSGHTHGGQVVVPGYGPPLLPVRNKRYTSGWFDLEDGRRLYINRALGYLRQVRFNCRPEVTVFRLKRKSDSA